MYSFAITAFDEMTARRDYGKMLLRCIRSAQAYHPIVEIVVVDDGSENFGDLARMLEHEPKVCLYRNQTNRGVFGNKLEAVARSSCEWVITCDSDNFMDCQYFDRLDRESKIPHTWCCPSFAHPKFDYRPLIGIYDLRLLPRIIKNPIFSCFFNTGNQTVHREAFMEVFGQYRDKRADLMMPNWLGLSLKQREKHYWRMVFDACDSLIFNLLWMQAGNYLNVVEGLEYEHHYAIGSEGGNYARSPDEKGKLGGILLSVLQKAIEEIAP